MLKINFVSFFMLLIFVDQFSAERISRQKCKEYGRNIDSCNFPSDSSVVQYGQFPHIASIGYANIKHEITYLCSGVLISDQYVITTAFCGNTKGSGPAFIVKLGILQFKETKNETHLQTIKVTEILEYPKYISSEKYHDISLLKLEHPVEINEYVRPACLPDLNKIENKFILTGWEIFNTLESKLYLTTYNKIFEISYKDCQGFYEPSPDLNRGIDASMHFCVGPSKTACMMLGGSPLQSLDTDVKCMYDIHSISSFGIRCPTSAPAVFTILASYIDWIEQKVWS